MARRELDNIEKDVIAAMKLGYGVHYGNYKADHPHTATETACVEPAVVEPMVCERCGQRFFMKRFGQKYCCTRCQQIAGAQRYYTRRKESANDSKTLAE